MELARIFFLIFLFVFLLFNVLGLVDYSNEFDDDFSPDNEVPYLNDDVDGGMIEDEGFDFGGNIRPNI